jgi:anti-sigma regulatory factor (Ser/Thr protein kinase)
VEPPDGASHSDLEETRASPGPFEFWVSPDPEGPAIARTEIARWLTGRVSPRVLDDARVVVTELVTNSVRHAGLRAGDVVSVRAEATGDGLRVEVEDAGRAGEVARRSAGPGSTGGFGLNIVEAIAERWGLSLSHCTRVWAELALS